MNKKLFLTIPMTLFIISCGGETETVANSTIMNEQTTQEQNQYTQYFDYSHLKINEAKNDQELYLLIQEDIKTYEGLINEAIELFKTQRESLRSEIQDNINELKSIYTEQKNEFDQTCTNITPNNVDYCNHLGEENAKLKTKINKVESELSNRIKELNVEEINLLNKYKARMEQNINRLLIQGGVKI